MKVGIRVGLSVLVMSATSCATGHLYPAAGSSAVLVTPSFRVWNKPGTTLEDEDRARRECGDELRDDEELRGQPLSVRSAAFHSCMLSKGFQYYKN